MDNPFQLTSSDLHSLDEVGIDKFRIQEQYLRFENGFPPLKLLRAVAPGDGVTAIGAEHEASLLMQYEQRRDALTLCKFVPSSGAASRMFRDLWGFLNDQQLSAKPFEAFFDRLDQLAFADDLRQELLQQGLSLDTLLMKRDYRKILEVLLKPSGLNYQMLPKALLKFHRYGNTSRTPMEDHLVEAVYYAQSRGLACVHFTVSPQFQALMESSLAAVLPKIELQYGVKIEAGVSCQSAATDTLSVDMKNKPIRNHGNLVLRPGGHGALLHNLNALQADLVFIKNVDNILPDRSKPVMVRYKKLLAALLISHRDRVFDYLHNLDADNQSNPALESEILTYLEQDLCRTPKKEYFQWPEGYRKKHLHKMLNCPLRVCGVIRSEKNTGGGPYWVQSTDGISVQLVETAQINSSDPQQQRIAQKTVYANITDIVCSFVDYKGRYFDLQQFVDQDTGFISEKSFQGHKIKALELPGLWNGSMAKWNSIMVEVPAATFNPVKTVFDLLNDSHSCH